MQLGICQCWIDKFFFAFPSRTLCLADDDKRQQALKKLKGETATYIPEVGIHMNGLKNMLATGSAMYWWCLNWKIENQWSS